MLKFTPILLALLYGLAMYHFSAWRTRKELDARSTELADPALKRLTDRMAAALDLALDEAAFSQSPSISIDYAVMEPTEGAAVVPLDAGWSDVGSWSTIWDVTDKDENAKTVLVVGGSSGIVAISALSS